MEKEEKKEKKQCCGKKICETYCISNKAIM